MEQHHQENGRTFLEVRGKTKLAYLIDTYLDKKKVFIKNIPNLTASLELINNYGMVRLIFPSTPPQEVVNLYELNIYTIFKRYIEITLRKIKVLNNTIEYKVAKANIANEIRSEKRYDVSKKNYLADNIKISKYFINKDIKTVPMAVRVSFEKFKPKAINEIKNCHLGFYDQENDDDLTFATRDVMLPVYIPDLLSPPPEEAENVFVSNLLKYKNLLNHSYHTVIDHFVTLSIRSVIVYPIVYTNLKGEHAAIGYFKIVSFGDTLSESIIAKLEELSNAIVHDIQESTIQTINETLIIQNVSRRGLQLITDHEEIIETFLTESEDMVLDIRPENRAIPITLAGKTASVSTDTEHHFHIGIQITGGDEKFLNEWDNYLTYLKENSLEID